MVLLLTGASGFVGRHAAAQALAAGHEVIAAGRDDPGIAGLAFRRCDLMDPLQVRALMADVRPHVVLHMAWYAEPGRFWRSPANLDWVARSLDLARAFAENGGGRLVVAGSCAEYDWSGALLDEVNTPLAPSTFYGQAKAGLFRLLDAAAPELGISLGWGRIFFPYGPGDRPERLLGGLMAALREGTPAEFSHGAQQRDFIHVADVAGALLALVASEFAGAVNIGTGEAIAVRALVEQAAELSGRRIELVFGARPSVTTEPPCLVAAPDRLFGTLGYRLQFDRREGLRDTLRAAGIL